MKISVVGLGKLGLPWTCVLARAGYEVIGVDVDHKVVQQLNQGLTGITENKLAELLQAGHRSIKATQDYAHAIMHSEVTFIAVPTPAQGECPLSMIEIYQALEKVGVALQQKTTYHLVVIMSTLMPGSLDKELQRVLERYAQRQVGEEMGLCYLPTSVVSGSIIEGLLRPDLMLIGESDPLAGERLESICQSICENKPPICRMNFINAELTHLARNAFVATKISYANMLSDLCDYLPDADMDVVTSALGWDSRIGFNYLRGATAFGGPYMVKDQLAMTWLAQKIGARADLLLATQALNEYQSTRVQSLVEMHALTRRIGVLGLAYKVGTAVLEESPGVQVANQLALQGYQVTAYDPRAGKAGHDFLMRDVMVAETFNACMEASDLLIIMTPWPEFAEMFTREYLEELPKKVVIDCWRLLSTAELQEVCEIVHLGQGRLSAICEL